MGSLALGWWQGEAVVRKYIDMSEGVALLGDTSTYHFDANKDISRRSDNILYFLGGGCLSNYYIHTHQTF